MSVLSRRILDGTAPVGYKAGVAASLDPAPQRPRGGHTTGRRRRQPPSLPEQRRRENAIRPWANTWKELKANGRWR